MHPTLLVLTLALSALTPIPPSLGSNPRNFALHIASIAVRYNATIAQSTVVHNDSYLSFTSDVRRQLNDGLQLRTLVRVRVRDARGQLGDLVGRAGSGADGFQTFANRTIDYCAFLRHPESDAILNLMHRRFAGDGNRFYRRCPITVVSVL